MTPFQQPQPSMAPPDPSQGQQPPQDPSMQGGMPPGMDPSQQMGMDPTQMQQPPMGPPPQEQDDGGMDITGILDNAILSTNLADKMEDEELAKIGQETVDGFEADLISVGDWLEKNNDWLKLALLIREDKSYPWPGASNVKYPLLSTAAMQFSARAYPTLVPADNQIVKSRVIGYDPDGTRAEKAEHIAKHMSYQIMHKMPDWEEDMDRLLMICSIVGVCFKETYKDPELGVVSEIVYPENLIVNYWAKSLEKAYRKTRLRTYTKNQYKEKVNAGEWLDIGEIYDTGSSDGSVLMSPDEKKTKALSLVAPPNDGSSPALFLHQHTFYDLDGDGYAEPVVITVHYDTKKIVRILARFCSDGVTYRTVKGEKKVVKIKPLEYFTDYQFLPNPDGSIYGQGFGTLLGPINEAINSLCNQLIDAGTINNLQSGFIGKGLRLQMKESKFQPGEWKAVNATGDDLKNSIFPLPTKEPSNVLFQLMNLLIQSGNQLASVAEIMVGKMPGQNTPASTTQETVDQAMKVFTAIYKRVYRAMMREFQKIFMFNRLSPEIVQEESSVLNIPLQASDYAGAEDDIIPAADPSGASQTAQLQQLQMVTQQLLPLGFVNGKEITMRTLKLIQIPDPEKIAQDPPPPPPDPKMQAVQAKIQGDQQAQQMDAQLKQQDAAAKEQLMQLKAELEQLKIQAAQAEEDRKAAHEHRSAQLDMQKQVMDQQFTAREAILEQRMKALEHRHNMIRQQQLHEQAMAHGDQQNQAKVQSIKAQAKAKPQPKKGK